MTGKCTPVKECYCCTCRFEDTYSFPRNYGIDGAKEAAYRTMLHQIRLASLAEWLKDFVKCKCEPCDLNVVGCGCKEDQDGGG